MDTIRRRIPALAAVVISLLLAACQSMKAAPAQDAGFLQDTGRMSEQRERFPFNRAWVKPGVVREEYDRIVIRPVNTDYLLQMDWWQEAGYKAADAKQEAQGLAVYAEERLKRAVLDDPKHRFTLVREPGPRTLVLEMALVEVVPAKAALGVLGLAALPARMTAVAVGSRMAGNGSLAMEARVRDGVTGEVLGMFADREEGQVGPVNLRAATWYGHAYPIIDTWAEQMIELANTPPDQAVEDSSPITLMPW